MSTSLLETQRRLQRCLLQPGSGAGDLVAGTEKVPAAVRLGIYSNAYRIRLVEALAVDFSALHAYLGDEEFERLVHAYIAEFPSHSFTLRHLGQQLCDFLRRRAPYAEHPDLYELAAFEWALCDAFDAADAPVLEPAALATLAPEAWAELRLEFHPSLQWLTLRGNAPALWSALGAEQPPPAFECDAREHPWMVWRCDLKLLFRAPEPAEAAALACFRNGGSFSEVCDRLVELMDEAEVPLFALGLLQQWLREGLLVGALVGEALHAG